MLMSPLQLILKEHPSKQNLHAHISRNFVSLEINTAQGIDNLVIDSKFQSGLQASDDKASKHCRLGEPNQPEHIGEMGYALRMLQPTEGLSPEQSAPRRYQVSQTSRAQ